MEDNNYEKLSYQIGELANIVEQANTVQIKNGGGRHVMFKRKEFDQMLYDKSIMKWRDMAKDIVILASVLTNVGLVLKAFGII